MHRSAISAAGPPNNSPLICEGLNGQIVERRPIRFDPFLSICSDLQKHLPDFHAFPHLPSCIVFVYGNIESDFVLIETAEKAAIVGIVKVAHGCCQ